MAYTLSDIATKVLLRIRDTNYSTAEAYNYLNDTLNDIYNEYRLPFMQTSQTYMLTIGVSDITNGAALPTNYTTAVNLTLTTAGSERLIPYRDFDDLDNAFPDEDDTTANPSGTPRYWYFYNSTIRVFPSPDRAYTVSLRYYKKPTAMTANSVPELPSQFEELLVMGAAYRIMQVKDNYDQAGIMQNKYDEILQKLVMQYSRPQTGSPIVMRINRGYRGTKFIDSYRRI